MRKALQITVILATFLVLSAVTISSCPDPVRAATLTVNSLNDPGDGICNVAECTLREAIAGATGGESISFEPSLAGETITLGSTLIIDTDLTIDGSGLAPHVSINGDNAVELFYVDSATVTLNALNLVAGNSSNRSGGGIFNYYGTLMVASSTLSANNTDYGGGGIYNYFGTLTVTNSTFSNNTASTFGGGIDNYAGTLSVTNSTFFSNSAPGGGGISNSWSSTLMVTNSTFSGNSADNGGGILNRYATNSLTLVHTILANTLGGGDCRNDGGTIVADVNNLIEANDGCGTPVSTSDPALGTLQDNGGPTKTMAITPSSPAYNAGDNTSCPATDQRGVARPQFGICDIGAYESTLAWNHQIYLPLVLE